MSLKSLVIGNPLEKRTILHLRDDGKFKFEPLSIENNLLIEQRNGKVAAAWAMYHKLLMPFDGYGSLKRGAVTIIHNRDIIFDPYQKVTEKDKPTKGAAVIKVWTVDVGESQRYKKQKEANHGTVLDKMIIFMGASTIILAIVLLLKNLPKGT
jgi:hypothetical protein